MIPLPTGSMIGGYRIEELAAHGGMGVVYRATEISLERPVALKLYCATWQKDARFRARFQRESRLAASIDHPHVIPSTRRERDDVLFIAMRWVTAPTSGATPPVRGRPGRRPGGATPHRPGRRRARRRARPRARAPRHQARQRPHRRGGHHRARVPGRLRAGQARRHRRPDRTGRWLGTVDYAAPEQIGGGRPAAADSTPSAACSSDPDRASRSRPTTRSQRSMRTSANPRRAPATSYRSCRAPSTTSWAAQWPRSLLTASRVPGRSEGPQ